MNRFYNNWQVLQALYMSLLSPATWQIQVSFRGSALLQMVHVSKIQVMSLLSEI